MTNYLAALAALCIAAGASAASRREPAAPAAPSLSGRRTTGRGPAARSRSRSIRPAPRARVRSSSSRPSSRTTRRTSRRSSLNVKVQIASLDTQDKDRDSTLAGAELFDAQKFPTATYVASSLARDANGRLEAVGKLTLRGVTRDLRIPLVIKPTAADSSSRARRPSSGSTMASARASGSRPNGSATP